VVVRYFGGTLLGTSGLINAYKESARLAIASASIIQRVKCATVRISFDYTLLSDVMNTVKKLEMELTHKDFAENAVIETTIPEDKVEETWLSFKAAVLKVEESQAKDIKHIGGLEWQVLP
jgi:putative IMPACT (imprinted ancient) family translation regulator